MAVASSTTTHVPKQRRQADEARCPSDLFNQIEIEALLERETERDELGHIDWEREIP